jgi:hypothetical protein
MVELLVLLGMSHLVDNLTSNFTQNAKEVSRPCQLSAINRFLISFEHSSATVHFGVIGVTI